MDNIKERFGELDTRRRLVFASSVVCMALPMGYFYSMGRTFVSIVDTFHTTRASAAIIMSTTMGCYMGSGILTGILIQRLGTRMCGMLGSVIFCGGLMVSFWANSVVYLIVSQGAIVEKTGIRWTFLLVGGLNLNCLALSLIWPSKPKTAHTKAHPHKSLTESFRIILRNRPFIMFTFGIIVTTPALSIFLIFVADTILDHGFTNDNISLSLLLLSVASTLGRPIPLLLKLTRMYRCPSLCIPLLTSVLGIVGMLLMAFVEILSVNLLSCCLVGMSMGILIPCYAIISVRLVGSTLLPTAMGVLFSLMALGNISVPPLSGIIRDRTDSYKIVYIIAAAVMALGGVFFVLAHRLKVRMDKTHTTKESTEVIGQTLLQETKTVLVLDTT